MTSAQRAKLRGMANGLSPVLQIGKEGLIDTVFVQADQVLEARELIKVNVQKACNEEVKDIARELAHQTDAEVVQVIGRRFILYRRAKKDPKILLF